MRIDGFDIPKTPLGMPPAAKKAETAEEAAKQFEEVLIKQMVHTMTKELFDSNLTGDDAPQWMGAYSDMQSDILTEELAKQLSESGRMGISELLLKQWKRTGMSGDDNADTPAAPAAPAEPMKTNPGMGPVNPYTEV